jgi:hypothetical protein
MIITIPIKPDHLYTRSSEDGLGILGFQKLLGSLLSDESGKLHPILEDTQLA